MDAELAFLKSMQESDIGQQSADQDTHDQRGASVDQEDEEDYDPSNIITESKSQTSLSHPSIPQTPPSAPLPAQNSTSNEPLPTLSLPTSSLQLPSKPDANVLNTDPSTSCETGMHSRRPRILGGFIVDDDEEDDDDAPVTRLKVAAGSEEHFNVDRGSSSTPQRSSAMSANNSVSPDVLESSARQDRGLSDAVPNDATNPVPPLAALVPPHFATAKDALIPSDVQSVTMPVQSLVSMGAETSAGTSAKARLPYDRIGMLEDRVKEDPRGDVDAWLSLINEQRKRHKLEDVRNVYDRFFKVFPSSAEQWVAYVNMELEATEFWRVEQIFKRSLTNVSNVQLWSTYLDYIRRRNILSQDPSGSARQVVSQSYDFVLQNIGIDKDSGQIWQDYIQFIRSGPGQIGGGSWQDQQKMDFLRKTYQRAVCIPTQAVHGLWKDYDAFEMGLNKVTGRKFLQEKSPAYMTARSSYTALQNITRDLHRGTVPILPPALGFDGDVEYLRQVDIWKTWIEWEKEDPLVLKEEDIAAYRNRVMYVYKQAVMELRFWPEMWFEAAEFCFNNGLESEGNDFLKQGIIANPESCLLAFKRADRIELSASNEEGEEGLKRRGDAVREPYDKVLDALYDLIGQVKKREAERIASIKENQPNLNRASPTVSKHEEGDEDDDAAPVAHVGASTQQTQIEAVQKGNAVQIRLLSRTISFVWIAFMRAMRRIQGKGKPNDPIGGSRQVFTDARKRGRLTSDVYVASALIEYHCYKDVAATKIFERGMKLFPDDEKFALEYLKHLIAINDITNARAIFEMTVKKLTQKPETMSKSKPIYAFFHQYEAHYGELGQVNKLEKRMRDLFPEDPTLQLFSQRYSSSEFDPTMIRLIISPSTQARSKALPSVEIGSSVQNSPRPLHSQPNHISNSPKRPFDDSDNETGQRRKIARAESPLKGAAGRRLDAQKRTQLRNEVSAKGSLAPTPNVVPPPFPREVLFLLSIIPRADLYHATVFNPEKLISVIQNCDLSKADVSGSYSQARSQIASTGPFTVPPYGYNQVNGPYGYGR